LKQSSLVLSGLGLPWAVDLGSGLLIRCLGLGEAWNYPESIAQSDVSFPLTPPSPGRLSIPHNLHRRASESQRDSVSKPRVASSELPWEKGAHSVQPQRGCGFKRGPRRPQPRWGWRLVAPFTQGSSLLATLGWRTQSLRDCGGNGRLVGNAQPRRRGHPEYPSTAMISAQRSFLPLLWGEGRGEGEWGSPHFHGHRMSEGVARGLALPSAILVRASSPAKSAIPTGDCESQVVEGRNCTASGSTEVSHMINLGDTQRGRAATEGVK
jgi:hypothetical protein